MTKATSPEKSNHNNSIFEFLCRKFGNIEARVLIIPPTSAQTVLVRLVVVDYANETKYETFLKQEDFPSVLSPMKHFASLLRSNTVAYKFVTEQAMTQLGSKYGISCPNKDFNHLSLRLNEIWVVLTPSNISEHDLMIEFMIQQLLSTKTSMTIMKAEAPKGSSGIQEDKVAEISEAIVAKALSTQASLLESKFTSAVEKLTKDCETKLKLLETTSNQAIHQLNEKLRMSNTFTAVKFSSTTNGGSGKYAHWNNLAVRAGNVIPWVRDDDTIIVPQGGMYLISSRYTLSSASTSQHTELCVNGANVATGNHSAQSHGRYHYDSCHIDEVFSIPSEASLKLLLSYTKKFNADKSKNKISIVRLNEHFQEALVGKWSSNAKFSGSNYVSWNNCILSSSNYTMSNSQLTFKTSGYYYVSARVSNNASDSKSYLRMEKNGNEISRSYSSNSGNYEDNFQLSEIIQVNANDWIRFYAEQNGSLCASEHKKTRLSVFKVPDRGIAKFYATAGATYFSWKWDNIQIPPTNNICSVAGSTVTMNVSGTYFVNIRCSVVLSIDEYCIRLSNDKELLADSCSATTDGQYDSFIINEVIHCNAGDELRVCQHSNLFSISGSTPCQYANVFSIFLIS